MESILFALWFFWPAGVATLAPVLAAKLPGLRNWNTRLDGGYSFRGKRLLGDNKTLRGAVAGVLLGAATFGLQKYFVSTWPALAQLGPLDYSQASILIGVGLGFGAIVGDALGSFAKRQRGVAPGTSWFPFDQIDFIVGALVCSLPFVLLSAYYYILIPVVWVLIHMVFNFIGYLLGWQDHAI